ncbi:MAG: glycosyltransferase family 4 protein [Ignavibacteriales bacterium]|nr:glycosyltransferase family 4 protein [Ignavibacteriales bacterium]
MPLKHPSRKTRRKIVIVGPAYPLRGGIAHYVSLLYRHLVKRHDVGVVTFSRQYPKLFFPGTSQEERESDAGAAIPTERLIDSLNPFSWISAARGIVRTHPDLVIFTYWLPAFGPCFGTMAALIRRGSGAKILFVCHNVLPHERRPGDLVFTRYAFRHADFFIPLSHAVARDLTLLRPGAPHTVVPLPVYESFGRTLAKSSARKSLGIKQTRVLLFFGIVRQYKGLTTLLSALPQILQTMNVHLFVVGEFYEDQSMYRKQIDTLRLAEHVTVVPEYVPRTRVAQYFSACDVVVLPYWSATQSAIIQIAYQFNKPVIATDVGGISEVVRDGITGLVVPARDAGSLANAVVRFYAKKMEPRLTRMIKKEKQRYSWGAMVRAIEALLRA